MDINYYSKKTLKLLGISLIIPFTLLELNSINKQIKAEKNLAAASEKDIFLYRQKVVRKHQELELWVYIV